MVGALALILAGAASARTQDFRTLGIDHNHLTLDGAPFFPIIADQYDTPTPAWVADVKALGANALFEHDHGCAPTGAASHSDLGATVHAALAGTLAWIIKPAPGYACTDLAQTPEAVAWAAPIRGIENPGFPSCPHSGAPASLFDTATVFKVVNAASRTHPVIWQTWIANESVPGRKTCVTGATTTALFWTVVAAGGAGLEYFAFVPAYTTNTNQHAIMRVNPDVQRAAATFSVRLAQIEPAIMSGTRISGDGVGSSTVRYGAWKYRGGTYAVAVNTAPKPTSASIPFDRGGATALWESRSVTTRNRVLHDTFAAFAVHVYVSR